MSLTVTEAARIMGGSFSGPDGRAPVRGGSIDTRSLDPGELFFALGGEFRDGHDFVAVALRRGAPAAVVTRPIEGPGAERVILVDDAIRAMTALAGWLRDTLNPMVVGITGSTGKTSVKDLLAAIAGSEREVVASEGSFNNELGLPLTLLRIRPETELVVCEMGARGPGQIRKLCDLARPQVGVVTNVGVTHYELFGSREAIAATKAELVLSLPEGGAAVLNADDPVVSAMRPPHGDVLSYGIDSEAWLRAEHLSMDRMGRPSFRMVRGAEARWVSMRISGRHQVHNALAAAAAGLALGLTLEQCRAGLDDATLSAWRMQTDEVAGVVVVNDAYNANPTSMASALMTCAGMAKGRGGLIAVLGYMAELGDLEEQEHRRVGALAASTCQRVVVVGSRAGGIAQGAREAGLEDVREVAMPGEAVDEVGELADGDVLLVKGSRVARLEAVAERVRERLAGR
ncbi:MAG: UDP-N-acetylmuramoyl-tripeptide--D-alanyl-D-alanine ligase [Actinomycetota bacterium]